MKSLVHVYEFQEDLTHRILNKQFNILIVSSLNSNSLKNFFATSHKNLTHSSDTSEIIIIWFIIIWLYISVKNAKNIYVI